MYYEINIAKNITAHIILPSGYRITIGGGIYHFAETYEKFFKDTIMDTAQTPVNASKDGIV